MRTSRPRRPVVICLVGRKGGLGKTTIGVSLVVEYHRRGLRVLFVDLDCEDLYGSATWWAERAAEHGVEIPPVVAMGNNVLADLPTLGQGYDLVVVDTPGAAERRTIFAMGMSTLALMPCGPSPIELAKMRATIDQVQDTQHAHPRLLAAIVATRVDRQTTMGRACRPTLLETEVPVLETVLSDAVGVAYALGMGRGPTTYEPRSEAAQETIALADELERLIPTLKRSKRAT